jgi:hypothetical protein
MITGLPPHIPPVVEPLRCSCGVLFSVYTGMSNSEATTARRAALALNVRFVYARREPFITCECGAFIDVSIDESLMVM